MSPDLFEKLKKIEGYKYEITIDAKGVRAKVGRENYYISKYFQTLDECAIWILKETTDVDREA